MPIFHSFKATNIKNAFILNSLASTITIVVAILLKNEYNQYFERNTNEEIQKKNLTFSQIFILMVITFLTSMITYTMLFFLFGFGGGMLSMTTI